MTTWGVVATIKAPTTDVLRFAAYHLSLGADQVFLYLDDANGQTGAGEGLAPDELLRDAQVFADLTDLVLVEVFQWVDYLFELH